jgi:hypothetical protein
MPKRAVGDRSVEGTGPLGRRKLRQIDLKDWPPVEALGRNYIRPTRGPRGLHLLPFPLEVRVATFHRRALQRKAPPSLGPPPPRPRMRTKSLVTFRSKCTGFEEGKMEKPAIPGPSTI